MRYLLLAYKTLVDALAAIAGILLVLAALAVVLDVSARYFMGMSFAWVFELTEYVLLYIPCLGMAWLARRRGHVTIDIATAKLSHRARRRLLAVTSLVAAAVCAFISYWGFATTYDFYIRGIQSDKVLSIPMWTIMACIPLGFGLTAVEFVRLAFDGEEQRQAAAASATGGA